MKKTTKILMITSLIIGAVAFGSTTASARSHRHAQEQDHRQVERHDRKHERKHFNEHSRHRAYHHERRHYRKHHNHYVTDQRRYRAHRLAYAQPEIHITPHGVVLHVHPNYAYYSR